MELGFAVSATAVAIVGIIWFVHFAATTDFKREAAPIKIAPPVRRDTLADPKFDP